MVKRLWTSGTTGYAAVLGVATLLGCQSPDPKEAREVVPELQLSDVRFRVHRGAALQASGNAPTLSYRRDSTEVVAHDVVALLHRSDGEPVRITAPVGTGVISDRRFQASGGVVLSRGTDVARTNSARYEPATPPAGDGEAPGAAAPPATGDGLVIGDDPLVLEGRGYTLTGPGFTLDPASGDLAIRGGARLVAGLPLPERLR